MAGTQVSLRDGIEDIGAILAVVNDAARAYRGVIAAEPPRGLLQSTAPRPPIPDT